MHAFRKNFFYHFSLLKCYFSRLSFMKCSTYKNTLLLPKTSFPHKLNPTSRRNRDQLIENNMKFEELYSWQRSQSREHEFILHDGPPYANGDVHIGHAVNKILKDITCRQKLLQGYKIHYVLGWDCHGLPIELKVMKNQDTDNRNSVLSIRKRAYDFSQQTKTKQLNSFKEWGLLADWENCYFTCHPQYVIQQLQTFQDLYDNGVIFQDYKPVFWSPQNRTSLAEAELEYNENHISPSIYIKFSVTKYPDFVVPVIGKECNLNILIWTTTPWTLPANQAVCYSSEEMYNIVLSKTRKEYYIVAEKMISLLTNILKDNLVPVYAFQGSRLKEFKYKHPIYKNRECQLFPAQHVTMTKGTGLVHTAPNHGLDDYFVAKKQNLPLDVCLVDNNGCFTNDVGVELSGKAVLDDGSKCIIDLLKEEILHVEDFVHSYPYDWRSKTPVIIKSSHQWFMDVQRFQTQAMDCLQSVRVYPEHLKKAFLNLLSASPQWCISRQRAWGVPIPALYSANSETAIVHKALTDHLCQLIEKHGIHCWWEMDGNEILPPDLAEKCGLKNGSFKKGLDIMDIWLDSGISWKNVLPEPQISDLCIEGIDQIRGWFNSSLMTSVVLRGKAPYKSLMFHGFTTDAEGRKMSKSEGNVISPLDIMCGSKKLKIPVYGIDVLRWWVASHACQHDNIAVKSQILEECSQNVNKLRNVFKFLLGGLFGFHPQEDIISPSQMRALDLYMLYSVNTFRSQVKEDYDSFQFKNVTKNIVNFTTNDVSSFYCHLIKDRLYCESRDSNERLSCQTVLYFILNNLVESVGPICPHLAEEVMMHHPNEQSGTNIKNLCLRVVPTDIKAKLGLFRSTWTSLDEFLKNTSNPTCFKWANQIRQTVLKTEIKTSNMDAHIIGSDALIETLKDLNMNAAEDSGYTEFFQVSSVKFHNQIDPLPEAKLVQGQIECSEGKDESFTLMLQETKLEKCPRCRRFASTSDSELCFRCSNICIKNSKTNSK